MFRNMYDACKLSSRHFKNRTCVKFTPHNASFCHFPEFLNRMKDYFDELRRFTPADAVLSVVFVMISKFGIATQHTIELVDAMKHVDQFTVAFNDLCLTRDFTQVQLVQILQE